MNKELSVVIPVYNEEEIIEYVVDDWVQELNQQLISYAIYFYNDGSSDKSLDILKSCKKKYPNHVNVIDKKNSGHGSTILQGYLENLDSEWIFQVDSDNEIKALHFTTFWKNKADYDFIVGRRINRNAPLFRKIMSDVSFLVVASMYGRGVRDVNCPYRLMKTSFFKEVFKDIPKDTFAPNVIISGIAAKKKAKIRQYKVEFETRTTRNNSLNLNILNLFKISVKSFNQTISYARKNIF